MVEPEVLYYKYDFNNQIVIRYERDGECNGCGLCCKYVIKFKGETKGLGQNNPIVGWDNRNGDLTLYRSGVTSAININSRWRYFRDVEVTEELTPCQRLTADNKCSVHIGKHLLSRVWPMSPEQAAAFPECSYTFREVERWTMDELWGADWEKATA